MEKEGNYKQTKPTIKIEVPEFGAPAGKLLVEAIAKPILLEGGLSTGGLK